jgi:hypothetical protein
MHVLTLLRRSTKSVTASQFTFFEYPCRSTQDVPAAGRYQHRTIRKEGSTPSHGKYFSRKIYYAKPHSTLDEPSALFLGISLLPGTR